jgi:nucleotide-binding universal stress UspA family protein
MIRSLIVALDGSHESERALGVAAVLSKRTGASVILFTDCESGVPFDVDAYMDMIAHRFGVRAEHRLSKSHDVGGSLADIAAHHPDSIIVMGSHGPTGFDEVVIGSVTAETLHATASPVLLLGPHVTEVPEQGACYETIITCVDGTPASEVILPMVRKLAQAINASVHIIQVVDLAKVEREKGSNREPLNELAYVKRLAQTVLDRGIRTTYDVVHDTHTSEAILNYARTQPSPIVAMASHGYSGLRRLTLGSVSMTVVRHATCPVLVVSGSLEEAAHEGLEDGFDVGNHRRAPTA